MIGTDFSQVTLPSPAAANGMEQHLNLGLLAGMTPQETGYPSTPNLAASAGRAPPATPMQTMTRQDVKKAAEADGKGVFIIDNIVYDYSQFELMHPGGKEVCGVEQSIIKTIFYFNFHASSGRGGFPSRPVREEAKKSLESLEYPFSDCVVSLPHIHPYIVVICAFLSNKRRKR
jgi:hypothetical protein